MLIVISPSKTLDYESPSSPNRSTVPVFIQDAKILVGQLQTMGPGRLAKLMHISPKLAELNSSRYHDWHAPFTRNNAKQALLAFKGDVYAGLAAESLDRDDLAFAQKHLRILSGLYGVLRPLDLMQAYRLEMGTGLKNSRGADLYAFWGEKITRELNKNLKKAGNGILINLASGEYFKSIQPGKLKARIITPEFREKKNGQYRFFSFYGKKARGLMSRYIIKNRLTDPEDIKGFNLEGYRFNKALSSGDNWVFTRAMSGWNGLKSQTTLLTPCCQ